MNDTKLLKMALLAMGLVGIVLIVMPQTISLFAGQHSWYNLTLTGSDVACDKCHGDLEAEMSSAGSHVSMKCWYCHATLNLTGFTYASGDGTGSVPGEETHTASAVECMECHEGFGIDTFSTCSSCHFTSTPDHPEEWFDEPCGNCHATYTGEPHFTSKLEAGGFNLTVNSSDTGEKAAHRQFALEAIGDNIMEGANEACIGCHTAADVNTTYQLPNRYEVNVTKNCDWTVNIGYGNFTEVRN